MFEKSAAAPSCGFAVGQCFTPVRTCRRVALTMPETLVSVAMFVPVPPKQVVRRKRPRSLSVQANRSGGM